MGKHTDELGKFEDYQAPWESATGEDQELNPGKLKKFLFNLLVDKAKAQDTRDEQAEKVSGLETELETAKGEVAKGDSTGKIAQLQKDLEKATTDRDKAQGNLDRLTIGIDKGLTPKQAARLQGTTKEELEADADELLETFGVTKQGENDEDDEDDDDKDEDDNLIRRTPQTLTNPSDPKNGADIEPDYDKIAAGISSGRVQI